MVEGTAKSYWQESQENQRRSNAERLWSTWGVTRTLLGTYSGSEPWPHISAECEQSPSGTVFVDADYRTGVLSAGYPLRQLLVQGHV